MPKPAHARKAALATNRRSKKKGKPPSKREIAQMTALSELGQGTYVIGAAMGRAPNTVRKYLESPAFHDPKFKQLVEEYKSKELLDLTMLNIESRARLHDLVPTMTPIETIALMDKSFTQRRLLEGKSTENIFSLRKIISEAHIGVIDATEVGKEQSSLPAEYPHGDSSGEAAETSGGNRIRSEEAQEEAHSANEDI